MRKPAKSLYLSALLLFLFFTIVFAASPREQLTARGLKFTADVFVERAGAGDLQAVKLFLAAGMDINARECCFTTEMIFDSENAFQRYRARTALMRAARNRHLKMVRFLLAQGADQNRRSNGKDTTLRLAIEGGNVKIVKLLLEHNADVDGHNEQGMTPLLTAAQMGHVELAQLLLDQGAHVNLRNLDISSGRATPLIMAVMFGHVELVRLLIRRGADVNLQMESWMNDTALDRANNPEIVRLLKAAGGKHARELK